MTPKPYSSDMGGTAALSPGKNTERYVRKLNGGAKQPIDLQAQKSFEL